MRLITFENPSGERRLGALHGDDEVVDLQIAAAGCADCAELPTDMLSFLDLEGPGLDCARRALEHAVASGEGRLELGQVTLRSPLPRPRSIRDFMLVEEHVLGSFAKVPSEWYEIPAYWKGNPDTVLGPGEPVRWPSYTERLDFELEMAAVIGRRADAVGPEEAEAYIVGYTIFNDWSARDYQMREMGVGIGPGLGKDFATSIGPCIATPDEVEPLTARMTAEVNGELWCEGSLGSMLFGFAEVISHLSAEQVLLPGDLIGSGTIARGCGLELDRWIEPGDVVELRIEGIGALRTPVAPADSSRSELVIGREAPVRPDS